MEASKSAIDNLNNIGLDSDQKWQVAAAIEEHNAQWKTKCDQLEQWKREAMLVMNPIMNYGQSHPDIKLGQSISTFVVEQCKQYDELKEDYAQYVKDFDQLFAEHATLKERADAYEKALRYIVQRDYTGASFVAQEALSIWKEGEQKGGGHE